MQDGNILHQRPKARRQKQDTGSQSLSIMDQPFVTPSTVAGQELRKTFHFILHFHFLFNFDFIIFLHIYRLNIKIVKLTN